MPLPKGSLESINYGSLKKRHQHSLSILKAWQEKEHLLFHGLPDQWAKAIVRYVALVMAEDELREPTPIILSRVAEKRPSQTMREPPIPPLDDPKPPKANPQHIETTGSYDVTKLDPAPTYEAISANPQVVESKDVTTSLNTETRGRKRRFGTPAERKRSSRAVERDNGTLVFPPTPPNVKNSSRAPKSIPNKHSVRRVLSLRQDGRCFFCGREFGHYVKKGATGVPQQLHAHVEHFIPRGEPGSRKQDNLHAACQICNFFKRRKIGFSSVEECRTWLRQTWELNGYMDLGNAVLFKFSNGEYSFLK